MPVIQPQTSSKNIFHGQDLLYGYTLGSSKNIRKHIVTTERELKYRFYLHLHPYVQELVKRIIKKGLKGLQDADTEYKDRLLPDGNPEPQLYKDFFKDFYSPNGNLVETPYPVRDLDFSTSGAYATYNWELFYHIPITIAIHLSKNQRFEEAQRWFHFIFDPTDDSEGKTPERFWKVKPFQYTDVQLIEDILINLSSGANETLQKDTINAINKWKENPFRPHAVARFRHTSYMFKAVMAYLDNLIEWGDTLFRQDSIETINEATQLYVLATNILGPKPQAVPKKGSVRPQTYANLRADLREFGTVLKEIETEVPFDILPNPSDKEADGQMITLRSIGRALYFCVPRNDKLLKYWDTVADRLYKIHNSLNIQGVFRQLPLFQPPIDPALLARAAAAGLDIGAVINGLNQPLPLIRFRLLVQKAMEIAQNVKALGGELLNTIEKEDNETLALLRAKHDLSILNSIESARYAQWQEAIKTREGLETSLLNTACRYIYYERLLGVEEGDIEIPELEALNNADLEEMDFKFDEAIISPREITIDIADDLSGEGGGRKLNQQESIELLYMQSARGAQQARNITNLLAAQIGFILPNIRGEVKPVGTGASGEGGNININSGFNFMSAGFQANADDANSQAGKAGKLAGYDRREQDWAFQSKLASNEINQIFKQITAAQIREFIAEKEWKNHQLQIENAKEIEQFLQGEKVGQFKKSTDKGLYTYLKRESRSLYNKYFQFAFDVAKKAEKALQHELGKPDTTFLKFDYLAGREGLYAGEKLCLDIHKMEMTYHDLNERELELFKNISIKQISPLALLQLKTTGKCRISIPEEVFDMGGCEGHYFRRIRSVALSIPCVTGPYVGVNCTLTLTKSSIRKSAALLGGQFKRQEGESERFSDSYSSLQSIVTSTAQTDPGLFDSNLNDERKLPFEYSGVISEWELSLADPADGFPLFDYNTITDIILHFQYTARQGGGLLQKGAVDNLNDLLKETGNSRLLSMKHEFPTEWHRFISHDVQQNGRALLKFDLQEEHYPFWSKGKVNSIDKIEVFLAKSEGNGLEIFDKADQGAKFSLVKDASYGDKMLAGTWENIATPDPISEVNLFFEDNGVEDMWILITWKA